MRVLVTGGAGYIGSVVAAQLLRDGHGVTVYDNLYKGHRGAVPEGARFVQGDLFDGDLLGRALRDGGDGEGGPIDAVMHFAALSLVGESVAEPALYFRNNVAGTLNLLDAMRGAGVGRLIFSSTAAVYGQPVSTPIYEDAELRPINPYGESKLMVETLLRRYDEAYGLHAVSLRYFNAAGAAGHLGEDHHPETHLIPNVLAVAHGRAEAVQVFGTDYATPDGTAVRDYIHVSDLARAHIIALEVTRERSVAYNLGNGLGFSVRQVVEAARVVTGHPIPVHEVERRAGDPAVLVAASERIQQELGWQPRYPDVESIIASAWEWRQAHPRGYE
jgi:UDP-glucose 4-epimerase